jgi:hypothetical protein
VDAVDFLRRIEAARNRPALRGWVKAVRWFLAVIFIWPGLEKLSGELFRRAAGDPGLLPFFDALHTTGLYWRFVGLSQVVAGTLLLFRRTALLGVLMCVPIYANIVVLLLSLPFDLPSVIAGVCLLLVNFGLLLWYAPELALVVRSSPGSDGSIRRAIAEAWRSVWVRRTVVGLALALIIVHVMLLVEWL